MWEFSAGFSPLSPLWHAVTFQRGGRDKQSKALVIHESNWITCAVTNGVCQSACGHTIMNPAVCITRLDIFSTSESAIHASFVPVYDNSDWGQDLKLFANIIMEGGGGHGPWLSQHWGDKVLPLYDCDTIPPRAISKNYLNNETKEMSSFPNYVYANC